MYENEVFHASFHELEPSLLLIYITANRLS